MVAAASGRRFALSCKLDPRGDNCVLYMTAWGVIIVHNLDNFRVAGGEEMGVILIVADFWANEGKLRNLSPEKATVGSESYTHVTLAGVRRVKASYVGAVSAISQI
jgi:hypothetical protein